MEVGDISKSIWDDLFSPPTKKVKVQTVQSAPLKPLNGGVRFDPETAAIVTNGMTFVPVIRDSQLILYPAPYLNGLSPNKEQHATPLYPNPRAIEDFKIPKRKIDCLSSGNLITSSEMSATSLQVSSEDVVSNSATLRRLKAGLQGNPLCLTFKVTSGDGRSWTNNKLEGTCVCVCVCVCVGSVCVRCVCVCACVCVCGVCVCVCVCVCVRVRSPFIYMYF